MIGRTNAVGETAGTSVIPVFTYSGTYELIDDGNKNWRIKFLTSGIFNASKLSSKCYIDAFAVGGGGSGSTDSYGGGGGGGCTDMYKNILISPNIDYQVTIGAGGTIPGRESAGNKGGTSSGFGVSAPGGDGGYHAGNWGAGGKGGSGGARSGETAGTDGNDGSGVRRGPGQHTTTREFGDPGGALYSNGADTGAWGATGTSGGANTGDGGQGANGDGTPGAGGSGIVVIRNSRARLPAIPDLKFDYSGRYTLIDDGNGNWRIKFLTSGVFIASQLPTTAIDLFAVGGGGGGSSDTYGGGGGGGYTSTWSNITIVTNREYTIVVGAGGAGGASGYSGAQGEASSAFGYSVNGGSGATHSGNTGLGGNGGSGGAGSNSHTTQGVPGSDGSNSTGYGIGTGQGTTTREFGESGGTLYSTGGAQHVQESAGGDGIKNTGDGGQGGSAFAGGNGGSGIVVIRNARST